MMWGRVAMIIICAAVSIMSFMAGASEMGLFFILAIAVIVLSMGWGQKRDSQGGKLR